jgi:hypothetical protein
LISFFLLSHEKKEHLRSYVPFRLSDAQAIVFIGAMLMTGCIHGIVTSFAYARLSSQDVMSGTGLEMAFGAVLLLLIVSYFFSQSEKQKTVTMSYLDKKETSYLDEYSDILDSSEHDSSEKVKDKNMTLPI